MDQIGQDYPYSESYLMVLELYEWFQKQVCFAELVLCLLLTTLKELQVQEYFGPGMSLSAHHSHSWDVVRDSLFVGLVDQYETAPHKNAVTAVTHPLLVYDRDMHPSVVMEVISYGTIHTDNQSAEYLSILFFPSVEMPFLDEWEYHWVGEHISQLQKFLRDSDRAKSCFVHGGMYAALSLQIVRFLLESQPR